MLFYLKEIKVYYYFFILKNKINNIIIKIFFFNYLFCELNRKILKYLTNELNISKIKQTKS